MMATENLKLRTIKVAWLNPDDGSPVGEPVDLSASAAVMSAAECDAYELGRAVASAQLDSALHTLVWLTERADRWREQRDIARADADVQRARAALGDIVEAELLAKVEALTIESDIAQASAAHEARCFRLAKERVRRARRQRDYERSRAERAETRAEHLARDLAGAQADLHDVTDIAKALAHDLEVQRERAGQRRVLRSQQRLATFLAYDNMEAQP